MKRGTPEHPKLIDLALRLQIPRYAAAGLLELLWHFTAKYAHAGNVGRFSNGQIAQALSWDGEPDELASMMLASCWLDLDSTHRLVVHDWSEHADQTVRRYLQAHKLDFIKPDGKPCSTNASTTLAPCQHLTSQPSPSPIAGRLSPAPLPLPETTSSSPGGDVIPANPPRTRNKAAKDRKPRPRNDYFDAFKVAFDEAFPDAAYPKGGKASDFVQLAAWWKEYPDVTPEQFVEVAKGTWAQGKFSDRRALTVKGLCTGWSELSAKVSLAQTLPAEVKHAPDYSKGF